MAGGAIDLRDIAAPEIFNPRQVQGHHHRVRARGRGYRQFVGECRPSRRQRQRDAMAGLRFYGSALFGMRQNVARGTG